MRTESYRVLSLVVAVAVAACAGPSTDDAALTGPQSPAPKTESPA